MSARFPIERLRELLLARPLSAAAWAAECSPHVHVRIGNGDVAMVREAAFEQLTALFDHIDTFGRTYCDAWRIRDTIFVETDASFVNRAGDHHVIPCVIIARSRGAVLLDLRFYLDPGPVPRIGSAFSLGQSPDGR